MKKTILAFCLFLVSPAGIAQEDPRPWMPLENRVGIAVGIGSHSFLDQNTSPLVYQSKPKSVRLFYQLESNHVIFTFDVDVMMGGLKPKYHSDRMLLFEEEDYKGKKETKKFPAGGSFLGARIGVGCFYKDRSTQESTFKVAAGIKIVEEIFYPQGWTSSGLMSSLSFAPQVMTQHRADEHHKFIATLRLPVFALVTRLPYHNSVSYPNAGQATGFFKNSEWSGVKRFIAPQATLGYEYQMSNQWGTGLTYDFYWYHVATEQKFRAMTQSLKASVYHQF